MNPSGSRSNFSMMMSHLSARSPRALPLMRIAGKELECLPPQHRGGGGDVSPCAFISQATTIFTRQMSTRSQGGTTEVTSQPPNTGASDSAVRQNDLKAQLSKLVDEEINESSDDRRFCENFLSTSGWKLEEEGTHVTLTKIQGINSVRVTFDVTEEEPDENDNDNDKDEKGNLKPTPRIECEMEEMVDSTGEEVEMLVQITLLDNTEKEISKLSLTCLADHHKLEIELMHSADGTTTIEFDEMSKRLQKKIGEYITTLGIDSTLSRFVFEYKVNYDVHKNVRVLRDLKSLLLY